MKILHLAIIIIIMIVVGIGAVLYYQWVNRNREATITIESPITSTPMSTITTQVVVEAKRVVTYAYRDAITGIDPSVDFDTGIVVLGNVYEPLLYYDPIKNEFKPALAIHWEQIDNTTWIFKLRSGVYFHDGTPLTAESVVFSILRTKAIYEKSGIGPGWIWDCIDDIVALNETTVMFKLRYPAPLPLIASSAYGAYIYSHKVLEYANAEDMVDPKIRQWFENGNDVGSGPYKIKSYKPDSEVILEKFHDWWGWSLINNSKAPDIVIIKIVEDPASQELGIYDGSIDIAMNIVKANIPRLMKDGFKVLNQTTFHNYILMFNVRRWPTNITEFRRAIAYAIPWDEVINFAFGGYGRRASGLIPYGYPGYVEGLTYEYNITKAREIINTLNIGSIKLELVITSGYEEEERFASLLKESLRSLGIDVDIVALPWEQVRERGSSVWTDPERAPHMIINDWWPTYPTPYDYLYILHSNDTEWNWSGYVNSEYDNLIDTALGLEGIDYEKALELYREAQLIIYRDVVAINICDSIQPYVYDPERISFREDALNPIYMYVIFFQYIEVK